MAVYDINRVAVPDALPEEPGARAKTPELWVRSG